jgi:hypothetical protein
MNNLKSFVVAALVGAAMFFAGRGCAVGDLCPAEVRVDTLVVRDTVREPVPVASRSVVTRVDTVWVEVAAGTAKLAAADTVRVAAEIPIERKTYQTADYRAEVEGFRASLVSMELFRETRLVTKTVRTPDTRRWGVELQAGWGLSPQGAAPYVGVGVGYRLFAW